VIIGGGAAGASAAETLRREGYSGRITLLSADESIPYDRPGLSKGYLYGDTPEADIPLRPAAFYEAHDIDLRLNARVDILDATMRQVRLADGQQYDYDALLLATGSEPVRLDLPGADLPQVCYLRTLADARGLVARAAGAKRAVVIGASFIGLEVAAALRKRQIDVHVVAPEAVPMKKIFGAEVGDFVRRLHERHGVTFHLENQVTAIDEWGVTLKGGGRIDADLIVVGVGVKPSLGLAERAGLTLDHGVLVDAYLQTSAPGVYAAGDIARWPDPLSGKAIRVEHWVVAQRQGQTAARNMLGGRERFDAVPFFWSEQYDFGPQYIGHAEEWDRVQVDGDLEAMDCEIRYLRNGQDQAVVMVQRDLQGLRTERALEGRVAAKEGLPV
jgi:NADPH-dependent 2,4-dienoyl-CoA reductase/sulfur reductase-like enzyme